MELKVDGLAELGEALLKFPQVLGLRYLRRATFEAAKVIQDDMIARAPVKTGALRDSIAIFKRKADDPSTAMYVVGVRKPKLNRKVKNVLRLLRRANGGTNAVTIEGDAYYYRFLEFGTSKMKAHPFMRPAFESQKENAVAKLKDTLAASIDACVSDSKR